VTKCLVFEVVPLYVETKYPIATYRVIQYREVIGSPEGRAVAQVTKYLTSWTEHVLFGIKQHISDMRYLHIGIESPTSPP
jgi:hypothetical protein